MREPADRHRHGLNAIFNQSTIDKGQACSQIVSYLEIALCCLTGMTDNGKPLLTMPNTKIQEFLKMASICNMEFQTLNMPSMKSMK